MPAWQSTQIERRVDGLAESVRRKEQRDRLCRAPLVVVVVGSRVAVQAIACWESSRRRREPTGQRDQSTRPNTRTPKPATPNAKCANGTWRRIVRRLRVFGCRMFSLRYSAAGMAIVAGAIHFVARMFEFLPVGRELSSSAPLPCARIVWQVLQSLALMVRLPSAVLCIAVVAAEAAGPDLVADVVRIDAPTGLHLGKEVVRRRSAARRRWLGRMRGFVRDNARPERVAMPLQRLRLVRVVPRQHINRVGLDPRQRAVDLAERTWPGSPRRSGIW